jgi:hypothetical protein
MQRSCYNTQLDPIGFNIDQYNDFKTVKDISYIKIGHFWKLIGNYSYIYFFSQIQQYFIIQLIGNKLRSLHHHQVILHKTYNRSHAVHINSMSYSHIMIQYIKPYHDSIHKAI